MMFKKKNERFIEKSVEYVSNVQLTILVDRETGVHYLHSWITSGGGGLRRCWMNMVKWLSKNRFEFR